jgi:protocatechuate 3,4-dioxygenase beta subunit
MKRKMMREDPKTFLFYILGLVGLIISSILFTSRIEPLPLEPLPSTPAKQTGTPTPSRSTEIIQEGCSPSSERTLFYIPDPASLESSRILITGTVYASDLVTPLPGALLEVLLLPQETQYDPQYPPYNAFHDWFQTDASGRYEATMPKPDNYGIIHLHYRANSQDNCPLKLRLLFLDASAQGEASLSRMKRVPQGLLPPSSLTPMKMARVEPAGTKLGGPIDVVLPVPPPVSFRANLIPSEVAGEPLTISGVVYAADRKTPLPGAQVEVWQANPVGFYEGYGYPRPAFNLQGRMRTDAAGRYEFTTLKPGSVKFGETYLPAQIRFKVSYQDQEPFFTRLYFADDPFLNNIPPAPEQTIQLIELVGPTGSVWQGNFDVFLPVSAPQP